jgi:hypothetical protein
MTFLTTISGKENAQLRIDKERKRQMRIIQTEVKKRLKSGEKIGIIDETIPNMQYIISEETTLVAKEDIEVKDIDGDKKSEVVIGEYVYSWNGSAFEKKMSIEKPKEPSPELKVRIILNEGTKGESSDKIAIIQRWDGEQFVDLWKEDYSGTIGSFARGTSAYDLFNDGEEEIIIMTTGCDPSFGMRIFGWNGKNYVETNIIDNHEFDLDEIKDLDGDGIKEIVFGGYCSRFPINKFIFDWDGKRYEPIINVIFSQEDFYDKGISYKIEGFGDIDGDNEIEIIVTNTENKIFICERSKKLIIPGIY